ncbi:MAG: enoyl-CoA hydratase-related protein [Pseudomonadota bacterium]
MSQDVVLVEIKDAIATVTLNRPGKRNALDNLVIKELINAVDQCMDDANIGVILLNANGDHFCAGADIGWMRVAAQMSFEDNKKDSMLLTTLLQKIYHSPKPVIALVHGATLGGGLGIIAASDITIAADTAVFAFTEVKIGITPSVISPYIIEAIGARMARYYFLTAERFDAAIALRLNLIHQIVDRDALNEIGLTMAQSILQSSRHALKEAKKLIHNITGEKINAYLAELTAEHLATIRTTPEGREGLLSFVEKRPPNWS